MLTFLQRAHSSFVFIKRYVHFVRSLCSAFGGAFTLDDILMCSQYSMARTCDGERNAPNTDNLKMLCWKLWCFPASLPNNGRGSSAEMVNACLYWLAGWADAGVGVYVYRCSLGWRKLATSLLRFTEIRF